MQTEDGKVLGEDKVKGNFEDVAELRDAVLVKFPNSLIGLDASQLTVLDPKTKNPMEVDAQVPLTATRNDALIITVPGSMLAFFLCANIFVLRIQEVVGSLGSEFPAISFFLSQKPTSKELF